MRVALLSSWPRSAIDYVMSDMRKFLPPDIESEVIYPRLLIPFEAQPQAYDKLIDLYNGFDLVHMGYCGQVTGDMTAVVPPITANIWHIGVESIGKSMGAFASSNIQHFFVDDTTTVQILGQGNITSVSLVPPPFDRNRVPTIPLPSDFTVGVFCSNFPHKRWNIVQEACEEADVECYAAVLPWLRNQYFLEPLRDVYPHVSVLVNASFCDTGSLPCFEALSAGRPVITTHSYAMHRVIKDGVNGYFFDGSVSDLAVKIALARENLDALRVGALETQFPDMHDIANTYASVWRRIVKEFE